MASFGPVADFAVFYEACVLVVFVIFAGMMVKKNNEKKNFLTRLLLWIFVLYAIGIFFSMLAKAINAVYGTEWYLQFPSDMLWLVGRLHDVRFGFACIIIASVLSYHLKVEIMNAGKHNPAYKISLYTFSIANIAFQSVFYEFDIIAGKSNTVYTVISFLLMFAMAFFVYLPITYSFFKLSRRVEASFKRPIMWLGVTHLCFILLFFFFGLDGLMLILLALPYSVFYYFIWLMAQVAFLAAYYGYIKPRH